MTVRHIEFDFTAAGRGKQTIAIPDGHSNHGHANPPKLPTPESAPAAKSAPAPKAKKDKRAAKATSPATK